jgi:hypothetical protein
MAASTEQLERLRSAKAQYEADLMRKPNVVGVGIGYRTRGGVVTDEPCIVASVTQKVPLSGLSPEDVIPSQLDGVPVDVKEVGRLEALEVGPGKARAGGPTLDSWRRGRQ